jgi:putative flippase GtrA
MSAPVRTSHLKQVPCYVCGENAARTFECVACKRRACDEHIIEAENFCDYCAECLAEVGLRPREVAEAAVAAAPAPESLTAHAARVMRFGMVGGLGFAVNLGVFAIASHAGLALTLCAVIAFAVAESHNFVWHRHFTFRSRHAGMRRQYVVFTLASALAAGAAIVLLHLYVGMGLHPVVSQALSLICVGAASFVFHHRVTFARRH